MWAIPTILFVEIGPLFMPGSQTSFLEYVVSLVGYSAVGIMLGYGFWKQTNDACQERLREGRCLSCNYDVREAKDRCPNCGNPKLLDSETPLHAARA